MIRLSWIFVVIGYFFTAMLCIGDYLRPGLAILAIAFIVLAVIAYREGLKRGR